MTSGIILIYHTGVWNISFTGMPGCSNTIQVLRLTLFDAQRNTGNQINLIFLLDFTWSISLASEDFSQYFNAVENLF